MNLASKRTIRVLLKKYQIRPSKKLGQNFLVDKRVIKKFIKAADLQPRDIILEIGPGIGTLTQEVAEKTKQVFGVEKDPKMCEILKETLKDFENVEIIKEDILRVSGFRFQDSGSYKVVGNLPFYLTVPIIRNFLESKLPPKEMLLFVQKEVGQRICAKPPDMSILAVSVQFYARPKIIAFVSRKSFWPQPKVDSAIIEIETKDKKQETRINKNLFFKIVKTGFSHPRKQLINNLSRLNFSSKNLSGQAKNPKLNREIVKNWLLENKIQPFQRAENLSVKDWLKLTKSFKIK